MARTRQPQAPPTIGALLKAARGDRSMRNVAEELGISDHMYKQWEHDFAAPDWDKATRIAKFTGTSRAQVLVLMGVLTAEEGAYLEQLDRGDGTTNVDSSWFLHEPEPVAA